MRARFRGICLISSDVSSLAAFYAAVLDTSVHGDEVFATVGGSGANLSIYSAAGMEQIAPGSMAGAGSGKLTLEFEVDDVDACYERLLTQAAPVVKPPTTQPWGRRSVWLRDPEGNIVNLYQPCRGQATCPRSSRSTSTGFLSSASWMYVITYSQSTTSITMLPRRPHRARKLPVTTSPTCSLTIRIFNSPSKTWWRWTATSRYEHAGSGKHCKTGAAFHQTGLVLLRLTESGQRAERSFAYTDLAAPTQ